MINKKTEKIVASKKAAKPAAKKAEPAKKAAPAKTAAPAKKPAPAKKAEPAKKDATRVYHVVKREDGKWQVKFAGGEKAIKLFDTQKEAIEYSKKMAENQGGAMLVHNSKGANKGKIKSK